MVKVVDLRRLSRLIRSVAKEALAHSRIHEFYERFELLAVRIYVIERQMSQRFDFAVLVQQVLADVVMNEH
jgi:hypothetical protein